MRNKGAMMNKLLNKKYLWMMIISFLFSQWAFSDGGLIINPITPVFNLDKGDNTQTIYVQNSSSTSLVCTPEISNDPNFVNSDYYIGNNIMFFPKKFTVLSGQTAELHIYLTNTSTLTSDGEYSGLFSINSTPLQTEGTSGSSNISFVEEGVLKVFKGSVTPNISLNNMSITNGLKDFNGMAVSGASLCGTANNTGNVQMEYQIKVTFFNGAKEAIDTQTQTYFLKRGAEKTFAISTPKSGVTSAEVILARVDDVINAQGDYVEVNHYEIQK